MMCYDGQLRNGSLTTHLILLSSTAAISATGGYVFVPKRSSRNEERTNRNEEQTWHVPSSFRVLPQNLFNAFSNMSSPVLELELLFSAFILF